jgi:CRP/FNR family transcriptional regulator, polysaccharide utilization system transcription regulator
MNTFLDDAKYNKFFGKPFLADDLFCDLSPQTSKSLAKIKQQIKFKKNEAIFSIGEKPRSIYVFIEGKAHLYFNTDLNERFVIRDIYQNEILGLTESLASFPYETGIQTLSNCICDCFPREEFIDFLQNNSQVSFRLLKMLGSGLQNSYQTFSSSIIH